MNESKSIGRKAAGAGMLVNVPKLITAYYAEVPDPAVPAQRVAFGTSGHRGSSLEKAFNEWHILAISQAICLYRKQHQIDGPLFLGMDTHALSVPAMASSLEVLAANGVDVMIADRDEYTPTPVISHAILTYNRGRQTGLADGIVITPSHNPPHDGGFKYNPPNGGPAESGVTGWIEAKANEFLAAGLQGVIADNVREGSSRQHDTSARLPYCLHQRPWQCDRHGRHSRREDQPGRGSARRRWGPLLGANCRTLRVEPHRRQRGRRSDFPLHDGGLGRPDSHGPILTLCDAAVDRHQGSLRDRLGLRHRS